MATMDQFDIYILELCIIGFVSTMLTDNNRRAYIERKAIVVSFLNWNVIKYKKKKYHTVATIENHRNRQIRDVYTLNTHTGERSHSWHGTGSSIQKQLRGSNSCMGLNLPLCENKSKLCSILLIDNTNELCISSVTTYSLFERNVTEMKMVDVFLYGHICVFKFTFSCVHVYYLFYCFTVATR
jgi:hypothetical protein